MDNKELLLMLEKEELPLAKVDKYLLEISWLEHPDVIRKMLKYKSVKQAGKKEEKSDSDIAKNWKVEILKNGTLKLLSYKGSDDVITVPEKIGEHKVTEIGDYVFSPKQPRCTKDLKVTRAAIKEVYIGDFIKKIGTYAFKECSNLEKVVLPEKLKVISEGMFQWCISLKKLEIPKSVTKIDSDAFDKCEKLEEVILPDGVKHISYNTFNECSMLANIEIPNSVTTIGDAAFWNCTALTNVIIPGNVQRVNWGTFGRCRKLEKVVCQEGVKEILLNAFKGCKTLKILELPETLERIQQMDGLPKTLIIRGKAGSVAEEYATKNGFIFEMAE